MSDPQTAIAMARLRQDCVLAKESLSIDTETAIPVFLPNRHFDVQLSRADFEDMIRAPIESTIGTLVRTLRSAHVDPSQLSAVLLVGGSSRIPLVARMISEELGRPTVVDAHPKYAVALGAATLARAGAGGGATSCRRRVPRPAQRGGPAVSARPVAAAGHRGAPGPRSDGARGVHRWRRPRRTGRARHHRPGRHRPMARRPAPARAAPARSRPVPGRRRSRPGQPGRAEPGGWGPAAPAGGPPPGPRPHYGSASGSGRRASLIAAAVVIGLALLAYSGYYAWTTLTSPATRRAPTRRRLRRRRPATAAPPRSGGPPTVAASVPDPVARRQHPGRRRPRGSWSSPPTDGRPTSPTATRAWSPSWTPR